MTKEDIIALKSCKLFYRIENIENLIIGFNGKIKEYEKGSYIKRAGDSVELIILLKGIATVYSEDYFGNRNIINKIIPGDFLGGAHVYSEKTDFNLCFEANDDCRALIINPKAPINLAGKDSITFLYNNLKAISKRCISFLEKIDVLSKQSIRNKVLTYLKYVAKGRKNIFFKIPFSRQELADYLSCDRSALSSELGKMKKNGLIDFQMNKFKLIEIL